MSTLWYKGMATLHCPICNVIRVEPVEHPIMVYPQWTVIGCRTCHKAIYKLQWPFEGSGKLAYIDVYSTVLQDILDLHDINGMEVR